MLHLRVFHQRKEPIMWITIAGTAAGIAAFLGLLGVISCGGQTQAQETRRWQPLMDRVQASADRGVLFAEEPISQYGEQELHGYPSAASLLAMLPRVRDTQSLANLITGNTRAIVVDRTSIKSLDEGFLRAQLRAGISVVGLNIPLSELAAATGVEEFMFVEAPGGDRRRQTMDLAILAQKPPPEPFYSDVTVTPLGAPYFRLGWSQKRFSENLFLGELDLYLGGVNADIGVRK
jgi:hypothetical protein